jgi:hypothetical protein
MNKCLLFLCIIISAISCVPNKYAKLQTMLKSNLPTDSFSTYIEMPQADFDRIVEDAVMADCESKTISDALKEIEKVDVGRRLLKTKLELSEQEIIAVIEEVKSTYALLKAARCW